MPITCQVVTKTYYVHVIGPLRAYYVTHVTRYLKASSNGFYYVHVIDLVRHRAVHRAHAVALVPDAQPIRQPARTQIIEHTERSGKRRALP